jgi:hypothetical protein
MYMTMKEVSTAAAGFGHFNLEVVETRRRRFRVMCGCGYASASRIKQADAAQAAIYHLVKAVKERTHGQKIQLTRVPAG